MGTLLRLVLKITSIFFFIVGLSLLATKPPSLGGGAVGVIIGAVIWKIGSRRKDSWRSDPATSRQKDFADELGIKYSKRITKGELSDLISEMTGR